MPKFNGGTAAWRMKTTTPYWSAHPIETRLRSAIVVSLSTLFGLVCCMHASPPDDPKLQVIIEGVRDAERLFQNISFEYRQEVRSLLPPELFAKSGPGTIKVDIKDCHLVMQKELFLYEEKNEGESVGKGKYDYSQKFGYDGEKTRVLNYRSK